MNAIARYILGVILTLLGAAISNFGIVLQKRQINFQLEVGPTELTAKQMQKQKSAATFRDPWFVLSIFMQTILCFPPFLWGFDYLGITLAAPLANGGIIFLVMGASWFLHERYSISEKVAIFLLVVSMVMLGFGGVSGEIDYDYFILSNGIMNLLIFSLGTLGLELIFVLFLKVPKLGLISLGFINGTCYGQASLAMQILTLSMTKLDSSQGKAFFIISFLLVFITTVVAIYVTQVALKKGSTLPFFATAQITMNIIPVIAGVTIFSQIIQSPIWFYFGMIGVVISSVMLNRVQVE